MKSLLRVCFIGGMCLISQFATAQMETTYQLISEVRVNGNEDTPYFKTSNPTGWDISPCASNAMVYVPATVVGQNKILSVALTAKAAGKRVKFMGTCDADNLYFKASTIMLE